MFSYDTKLNDLVPYITLSKPKQYDQNILRINVTCKGQSLGIQTPRLSFERDSSKDNHFKILFEGKTPSFVSQFYSLLKKVDQTISEKTTETLRKYITNDVITDGLYSPIIQSPEVLGKSPYIIVKVLEGVVPQNISSFPSFGVGTFMLALDRIIISPTTAHSEWVIVQSLIHLPKMKVLERMSIKEPAELEDDEECEELELKQITVNLD